VTQGHPVIASDPSPYYPSVPPYYYPPSYAHDPYNHARHMPHLHNTPTQPAAPPVSSQSLHFLRVADRICWVSLIWLTMYFGKAVGKASLAMSTSALLAGAVGMPMLARLLARALNIYFSGHRKQEEAHRT
jgi:hypothetical protein